ncbi:MAG: porin [Gammaproteobacteria bacterium]|nr:porin [Gammaproteobacteria bacterium]
MKIRALLLLLFLISAGNFPTSDAGEAELARLLEILQANGTITAEQYRELIGALQSAPLQDPGPRPQPAPRARIEIGDDPAEVIVSSAKGGVEVSSYDGESSFELGGLVVLDLAHFSEEGPGDGAELRRARLDIQGSYLADFGYALEVDFAGDEVDLGDVYLEYLGWYPYRVRIGQIKEPFGLERQTSSRYLSLMERALPNELAPGRSLGVGLQRFGSDWTLAAGLFAQSLNSAADDQVDQGWGVSARATYTPLQSETRLLHLGLSGAYRSVNAGDYLRFESRPEAHKSEQDYLDTGKKEIDNAQSLSRLGLELAATWGALSLQGEYIQAVVDQRRDEPSLNFSGWYLQGSWFLTGESRSYEPQQGVFGRIHPRHFHGAWELALRVSELDLDDENISGGRERNYTFGLNWYLNPNVRLMANYIRAEFDRAARSNGDLESGSDLDILQMRVQAEF